VGTEEDTPVEQRAEGGRSRARGGIGTRIVLIVLLAALPAFGLLLYHGFGQRERSLETARRTVASMAGAAALRNRALVEEARRTLHLLARLPGVRSGDGTEVDGLLKEALGERSPLANLGIADREGKVLASALPFREPVSVADRAYFRRAVEEKEFAVGDCQIGRITGIPSQNVALPLLSPRGNVERVLFAAIDLRSLESLPGVADGPDRPVLLVLDPGGTVLLRHPRIEGLEGRPHPVPEFTRAARGGRQLDFRESGSDGVRRVYGAAPLLAGREFGATVFVGVPEESVVGPVKRDLAWHMGLLAAAVGLAALGAGFLGRWLVGRHADRLLGATRRIAAGELTARAGPVRGPGEIGEIATAFDEMAEALQRRGEEVERARSSMERARDSYRTLVEEMPAIFYQEVRGDGRREVFLSPRARSVFHIGAEEWQRDPEAWTKSIHPEDREAALHVYESTLSVGGPFFLEYRVRTEEGDVRWIRDAGTVVREDGGVRVARGFAVDITDQRRAEERFQQVQKMEAMGRLASGVAHDFNNLLTVIGGYAQLLGDRVRGKPELSVPLDEVRKASDRAADLVRQLLLFSRRQAAEPVVVDPNAAILDLQKMLSRLLDPGIELRLDTSPEAPRFRMDRGHLDQVLMNLVVNARDALPNGGRIMIRTGRDFPEGEEDRGLRPDSPVAHAVIEVTDDGIGMDATTKARVFEPFFTTKGKGKGTGLGLATVYGIVRQAGGSIDLRSEPGQGTTFRILLPEARGPALGGPAAARPPRAFRETGDLLVVEDEPAIRALVGAALRAAGFTVHEACRGDEAEAVARGIDGPLMAALLDIGLPGKRGDAVARCLRRDRPGLPILLMSGSLELVGGADVGEEEFTHLQKPFRPDQLLAALHGLLEGP
jgi:two-component system cell cycle sensor histidine kinase/response regulator CckA